MNLDKNFISCDKLKNVIEIEQNLGLYTKHFTKKKKEKVYYYDVISAFDIETTSLNFIDGKDEVHHGTMYINMIAVNGHATYFRTWDEYYNFTLWLKDTFKLNYNNRLIIWVHNLSFEFSFIEHMYKWVELFARQERKPITALTDLGIEFRCSYVLSGASLDFVLKNEVLRHDILKKTGDLNYTLLRGTTTPLTPKELKYCLNDVMGLSAYICEVLENENVNLAHIRLTKTGQVRNYCFNKCLGNYVYMKGVTCYYKDLISGLTIQSNDEYLSLKRAFQGGFTHANIFNVGKVLHNVTSYDFTSSYPAVMCSELYPMSKSVYKKTISYDDFIALEKKGFLFIMDIHIKNVYPKLHNDNIISISKCWNLFEYKNNNGRVAHAKNLCTTVTNIDLHNIEDFYNFELVSIKNVYMYRGEYLPKKFIESVLDFYSSKTTLKDVEGKEVEYLLKKGMLNSCYGMSVTDIVNDVVEFDTEWKTHTEDITEQITKYNKSRKRFLFYPWGVFVTAYARNNLYSAIKILGSDYIYADTDSVKITNADKYNDYFNSYNENIINKINTCLSYRKIDLNLASPQTIKGTIKPLGVWDFDGFYDDFKTLGAKRYLSRHGDTYKLTCAGTSKKSVDYIVKNGGFNAFNFGLVIPYTDSGRNVSYYSDLPMNGEFIDYLGNKQYYNEKSGLCLQPSDFTLKHNSKFEEFISSITGDFVEINQF